MCVCVRPREDAEMKVTGEEVLSNHKRRQEDHKRRQEASPLSGCLFAISCSDPVQDVNEERTATDNSRLWLQRSAIRPNTKTRSSFLPCYCMCLGQEEGVHGLRIHSGQIRWGGSLKPLAEEPSVVGTWAVLWKCGCGYGQTGMVRRLRSCREGQKPKGERGTDCLMHWRLSHTHEENPEGPGPVLPRISPSASTLFP